MKHLFVALVAAVVLMLAVQTVDAAPRWYPSYGYSYYATPYVYGSPSSVYYGYPYTYRYYAPYGYTYRNWAGYAPDGYMYPGYGSAYTAYPYYAYPGIYAGPDFGVGFDY